MYRFLLLSLLQSFPLRLFPAAAAAAAAASLRRLLLDELQQPLLLSCDRRTIRALGEALACALVGDTPKLDVLLPPPNAGVNPKP